MSELTGHTVLITGATRGIGKATARQFAHLGARVVLLSRATDIDDTHGVPLREAGFDAYGLTLDVRDHHAAADVVDRLIRRHGSIEVLVNNAGVMGPVIPLHRADLDAWRANIETNLLGPAHLLHAVLPHMHAAGTGVAIQLSSVAAALPVPALSAYAASKAGLDQLVRVLALESQAAGVRIYGLYPGVVDTPMQAEARRLPAEEAGELADILRAQWSTGRLRPASEVAAAILWLVTGNAPPSGSIVDLDEPLVLAAVRAAGSNAGRR